MPSFVQMMTTNLPLHMGGLGLRNAVRLYPAAHWASWADTVAMVQERRPEVATILVENLTHHTVATSINSVQQCQRRLAGAGFELPAWDRLVEEQRPSASEDDEGSWGGWQQKASEKLERDHFSTVRPTLTEPEQAMVLSQGGPLSAEPFVCVPTSRETRFHSAFSGFSCCVASSFHFNCQHACAGVAVSLTFLATTGPHVPRQECWDVEVSQLKAQRPAFAVKAEVVSGPTSWSGTSIRV